MPDYEAVIGLETHIQLNTTSKIFCGCKADSWYDPPNSNICPVCCGLPGVLPVLNEKVVEKAVLLAAAMHSNLRPVSYFDRKNYFYPDLPKGYQISQYEYPLAQHGKLLIRTAQGERTIRIRRVHLEEDTGKLTHVSREDDAYSLVDLNRAGVPLLEIVSEPDMHSPEEGRAYAYELRALLRCLEVNSGDMEKGVLRFEANVSIRPAGRAELGIRTEIKNLNSFRALEHACAYEIQRQSVLLERGEKIIQETVGWDEPNGVTFSQRSKEEAHDYRYFPEPDLPPLVIDPEWIERVAANLPELPHAKALRLIQQYGLLESDARLLAEDSALTRYFEDCARAAPGVAGRTIANWITGELFGWMNQSGQPPQYRGQPPLHRGHSLDQLKVSPQALAELLDLTGKGEINFSTAKAVLVEMLNSGQPARALIAAGGHQQISDAGFIKELIQKTLAENPQELASFLDGKETLANWFFGQIMKAARGHANPQVVQAELERQLTLLKKQ
jgi:aspartyl-tRNA(Asn)/glutamyl-tRNA(Gln) amidotransferase subunit B